MNPKKPIFIDRDGVLNKRIDGYVSSLDQLELFPWTAEALALLSSHGFEIFVISNQQGVGLGVMSAEELDNISEHIQTCLREKGAEVKKFYYCTAIDSSGSSYRKPSPGMVFAARDEFLLDLAGSFFIGDNWSDIECAARAGCVPLLVMSGAAEAGAWEKWRHKPEKVFATLEEAAEWIVLGSTQRPDSPGHRVNDRPAQVRPREAFEEYTPNSVTQFS